MPSRSVTTEIWSDPAFAALSSAAQLIFLRLVTGPETTAAGTSRAMPKSLAVDCNLSSLAAEDALNELVDADLVRRYDGGWLWLPAWIDHQVNRGGMLIAARREAARRGLPRALSTALTRRLDARHGPAPKTGSDEPRTQKAATSRGKGGPSREGPDTLPTGSRQGPGTYQYQDPLPSGGGGPMVPAPAPAPGAQAPAPTAAGTPAVALAEVADTVTDPQLAALLAGQAARLADPTPLPDPGPVDVPDLAAELTIDDEERPNAAGVTRREEDALVRWQTTGDPAALAEIGRSGSPAARDALRRLLSGTETADGPPPTPPAPPGACPAPGPTTEVPA